MRTITSIIKLTSLLLIISLFACKNSRDKGGNRNIDSLKFVLEIVPDDIEINSSFKLFNPTETPLVPNLLEVSGIVQSFVNKNSFWIHEDSGSEAVIYLYSSNGQQQQSYYIKNISKFDYEDISIGLGPQDKYDHIYLGDIGNNRYDRQNIFIYRFEEPNYSLDPNSTEIKSEIDSYSFIYEDGPQNCEAFFLEPNTGDLYLFTKNIGECRVYTSPFPFSSTTPNYLKIIGKMNIEGEKVTAADISNEGNNIVIKTYNYIFYWKRENGEILTDMFKSLPTRLPYTVETQGEAFCWENGISSYITVSESNDGSETKFIEYK